MAMNSFLEVAEFVADGLPSIHGYGVSLQFIFDTTDPDIKSHYIRLENAYIPEAPPSMLCQYIIVEHIIRAPYTDMVSTVFPDATSIPGITFDCTASPMFSTKIAEASSGKETRTSYWENPLWEFSISFDYLPDATNAKDTMYKVLCGFFLDQKGRYKDFLFKPTNLHRAENVLLGTGDGANPEFTLIREVGAFREPIGQYDPSDISIWVKEQPFSSVVTSGQIVAQGGITEIVSVVATSGPTTLTQVPSAPGANEYSVDLVTGVFTFNASREGQTIEINYTYLAELGVNFNVTAPRTVVFDNAPGDGAEITGTYEYFFVCRFKEDMSEYNQFYNRLWELDQLTLRSQII